MSTGHLRDGWIVRSLESIAEEVIRRVPDPRTSGLDRFVSSSCVDRHDVRVARWESTADVVSAAKQFEPGDYLLVRRSLYATDFRERAPQADFVGVCSADILTIRERQGEVAPGFLQHLLYDKGFWDFIVANSTGSITRRIKWRQIAKYEFALPPIDEQQRIVGVLGVVEELESSYLELLALSDVVGSALLQQSALTATTERVGNLVVDIRAGSTPRRSEPSYYGGSIPWLKSGEVAAGRISQTAECITDRALAETPVWLMPVSTVVMALYGDGKTAGSVGILEKPMACNQAVLGLIANETRVLPDYLYWVLRRQKEALRNQRAGSSQANLNKEIVSNFRIPVPSLGVQEELLAEVSHVEELIRSVRSALEAAKPLRASLLELQLGVSHVQ